MIEYLITWITASWGWRAATGPDWHGSTTDDFYALFGLDPFTMSYETYMLVAEEYRAEIDACPNVSVTGRPCEHGDEKTEICPDGSVVQTHVCIPPDYVATGVTCTTECKDGNTVGKTCPDGSTITLKRCVEGVWVDTGEICPDTDKEDDVSMWLMLGVALIALYLYLYLKG